MKEKATFYFSPSTINTLEDEWIKLKRKFKYNQLVTKSLIVDKLIEIGLKDLVTKKENSDLYKALNEEKENELYNSINFINKAPTKCQKNRIILRTTEVEI